MLIEDLVKFGEDRGLERGLEQGLEQGREQVLARQFARRLGRPLDQTEGAALQARLRASGAERLSDVVLELEGDALARWLADPNASLRTHRLALPGLGPTPVARAAARVVGPRHGGRGFCLRPGR